MSKLCQLRQLFTKIWHHRTSFKWPLALMQSKSNPPGWFGSEFRQRFFHGTKCASRFANGLSVFQTVQIFCTNWYDIILLCNQLCRYDDLRDDKPQILSDKSSRYLFIDVFQILRLYFYRKRMEWNWYISVFKNTSRSMSISFFIKLNILIAKHKPVNPNGWYLSVSHT